ILPSLGPLGGPEALMRVAQQAEALDYHSVWVADRLLYPVAPRTPYPATPDGSLPEYFKRCMDPVETLTFVAAHTRRITLGTSVLNVPFSNPLSPGPSRKARASRADELTPLLKVRWGPDPVEFQGRHFRVAPSIVGLKPVRRPHPPIYLAGYVVP